MIAVIAMGIAWIIFSRPGAGSSAYSAPPSPRIGFAAPDFTLDTLDGGTVTLSELRGRAVLLNFWASWCLPCRTEMPAIERVHQRLNDQGLAVIGLNVTSQDTEAAARAFAQEYGLTFPIALDREGRASAQYDLMGLPSTYFIDRDGVVREVIVGGPMSEAVMLAKLEALLKAP